MGEEAFYTNKVEEYIKNSRFPTLSRYRDLITFLKNVFSDGIVSDSELRIIEKVEKDILLEYELAAHIYSKLENNTPKKDAAQRLLKHLYRCFIIMSFAKDKATLKNKENHISDDIQNEKSLQRIQNNKILTIKANVLQNILLKNLGTIMQRIEADLPRIRKDLARIPAEERVAYEGKINATLDQLELVNSERLSVNEINKLLGLEQHLKDFKERIYE